MCKLIFDLSLFSVSFLLSIFLCLSLAFCLKALCGCAYIMRNPSCNASDAKRETHRRYLLSSSSNKLLFMPLSFLYFSWCCASSPAATVTCIQKRKREPMKETQEGKQENEQVELRKSGGRGNFEPEKLQP